MKTKLKMYWTKTSLSLALIFLFIGQMNAQVGFDNPNPDPSAVVDIASTSKGLLIPRLTSAQRAAMAIGTPAPAEGLLVFDTDVNRLFYFDDAVSAWRPVNFADVRDHSGNEIAHIKTELTVGASYVNNTAPDNGLIVEGNVGVGVPNPTKKLEINGEASTTSDLSVGGDANVTGTVNAASVVAGSFKYSSSNIDVVPAGVIVMWSGSTASVPVGWALCNGANGTPNLVDRFVVGAGSTYSVNTTGGSTTHTHTEQSAGNHTHTIWQYARYYNF